MAVLGPALNAIAFVLAMSLVREPARQQFNAILVAGAGAAYLNGGLGFWEYPFIAVATAAAYLGLRSYRWIGVAWLLHTGWDVVHHLYGNPIWPWHAAVLARLRRARRADRGLVPRWARRPSYALARRSTAPGSMIRRALDRARRCARARLLPRRDSSPISCSARRDTGAPPLYADRCSSCHGDAGRGDGLAGRSLDPRPRNFADRGWQESISDDRIRLVIRHGGRAAGLSALDGAAPGSVRRQLDALVSYIRCASRRRGLVRLGQTVQIDRVEPEDPLLHGVGQALHLLAQLASTTPGIFASGCG